MFSAIFDLSISKYFIPIYSLLNYTDPLYLTKFAPASGHSSYQSFQDFFTRQFVADPTRTLDNLPVWPCEGLLCDVSRVDDSIKSVVKGQILPVKDIFGTTGSVIPNSYYFANVFLHNRDYHRIHAPVSGVVKEIEHVPGELMLLRPWVYPEAPSLPAVVNERYVVTLRDHESRDWFLSIVGGPGVASIVLNKSCVIGCDVKAGEEIAMFLLGSTCCIAGPVLPTDPVNSKVWVGKSYARTQTES